MDSYLIKWNKDLSVKSHRSTKKKLSVDISIGLWNRIPPTIVKGNIDKFDYVTIKIGGTISKELDKSQL